MRLSRQEKQGLSGRERKRCPSLRSVAVALILQRGPLLQSVAVALSLLFSLHTIIIAERSISSRELYVSDAPEVWSVSKMKRITEMLESSTIRYYVYDDDKLVLSDFREKATQHAPTTWRKSWGERYFDYSRGEIRWIEALERHPQRTRDPCEADFFVVPIPVGAALFWGKSKTLRNSFETLFNNPLFQQYPERHVAAFATSERIFGRKAWGMSDEDMDKFKSTMVVRDSETVKKWPNSGCKITRNKDRYYFSDVIVLGFGGEGSKPSNAYNAITSESWNRKRFWYFYHIRPEPFVCNSTQYRRAFFRNSTQLELFEHQPFSIGFDLPPDEWAQQFSDSKFCLVIRGDNPGSRALTRAIRAGCMPLIVSDVLPVYQPLYKKTLKYEDFAVMVKEEDFLEDPIASLDKAITLSKPKIEEKLKGLRLMQRILSADKPDSLFVPAFAREVFESMKERGLAIGPINATCNSRHYASPV